MEDELVGVEEDDLDVLISVASIQTHHVQGGRGQRFHPPTRWRLLQGSQYSTGCFSFHTAIQGP